MLYAQAQRWLEESAAISREIGRQDLLCDTLSALGCVAHQLGHTLQAREHFYAALRTVTELFGVQYLMAGLSLSLVDQGRQAQAVELYALALRYPLAAHSRWFEDVAGRHIAAAAATLPPDVVAAAQERGRARDPWAAVKELLAELEE